MDVNVVNKHGFTALDVVEQMPKDVKTMEIKELLISAGALNAKEIKKAVTTSNNPRVHDGVAADYDGEAGESKLRMMWKQVKNFTIFQEKKEKRDESLLVAATVVAAMAYQAAISPPGGMAGMDAAEETRDSISPFKKSYYFGPAYSLLALFDPEISNDFWIFNTTAFLASLSVIFIFVSGAALKRPIFLWLIRAAVWITLSSMTFAYVYAVKATTPKSNDDKLNDDTFVAVELGLFIWIGFISLSFFVLICRSIRHVVGKKRAKRNINTREAAAASRAQILILSEKNI
ncbi:uncharacterized protein LOC108212930 [Daucus carota subsp. sativus]|uniref:uncharacterized protein LOC108212930 n=1 Tax=Daucus carota subsp. sativus TaxID=79200 RepID=UPI0007F03F6F|nr:PREDICTED: uncharacterized protein LOC108212930 [Daucus carota subsp. sativus]